MTRITPPQQPLHRPRGGILTLRAKTDRGRDLGQSSPGESSGSPHTTLTGHDSHCPKRQLGQTPSNDLRGRCARRGRSLGFAAATIRARRTGELGVATIDRRDRARGRGDRARPQRQVMITTSSRRTRPRPPPARHGVAASSTTTSTTQARGHGERAERRRAGPPAGRHRARCRPGCG